MLSTAALLFFVGQAISACVDQNALSTVDVYVHKSRNSKAIKFQDYNFHLLDDYLSIDVSKANIGQLCQGTIKNFLKLETLSLINVNLTLMEPGAFQDLPRLKHLSLSVNSFTRIKNGVFNRIPSLVVIYLTRNMIETIEDGSFSEMPNLKAVHLNHNKITELSGNIFFGSPKISYVDFSFNSLKRINAKSFDDLRPNDNIKLLTIILKKNYISKVEKEALEPLIPVDLHLESNNISLISDIVDSVKERSTVHLDDNTISCISDNVIDEIRSKKKTVIVKKNPLQCDCVTRIENLDVEEFKGELIIEPMFPCNFIGLNYT